MATNAVTPTTDFNGGEFGTDAELLPLIQSQATPPPYDQSLVDAFTEETRAQANAAYEAGIGMNDDSVDTLVAKQLGTDPNAPKIVTAAYDPSDVFSQQISPEPNILDKFSSYTYHASLYVMSPEQYNKFVYDHKKTVNGYQLLIQSGGAPVNTGGFQAGLAPTYTENNGETSNSYLGVPTAAQPDAGRNPAFPNDFYFDSITVENRLVGSETQGAHSATSIKFTIIEPNGITLIDRLYQAVQDYLSKDGKSPINYVAVTYLMVIRFYGYDENGNLVTGIGKQGKETTDPNAVVEKFIPFRITDLQWSVQNKLVQYNITGATTGFQIAAGTRRGTVPHDLQLSATSVAELLGTGAVYSNAVADPANPGGATTGLQSDANQSEAETRRLLATAPPNASAAPSSKKVLKQGLMGAMNDIQQGLVQAGIYEIADEYDIVFVSGAENIASAKIVPPGTAVESKQTPMSKPATESPDSLLMSKISKDTTVRNWSVTAGMQLIQAIDLAIRNSTYILNQQLIQDDPTTDAVINNPTADGKPVTWFQVGFKAVSKGFDKLRNDYAYKITFEVSPYRIENYNSKYFPVNKFRGLHKSYQYWFTGQNVAVLDYQENMNNLYNITVSGTDPSNSQAALQRRLLTSSMREVPFYNYQAASTESRQGSEGKAFEGASNLAEVLYDTSGLARAKLKIIGDPAWMQQGSMAGGVTAKEFNFSAFLPDGTINFDASQIMFEIAWQRPQDYNLQTGLADPYSNNPSSPRLPLQSRVYTATKVVSEFSHGKFEQTLEGLLYYFVKPDGSNKAVGTSAPVPTQADPRDAELGNSRGTRGKSLPAALAGNRGQAGPTPVPADTPGSGVAGSGNSTGATSPTPADQIQPAEPATPATSGYQSDAGTELFPPTARLDRVTEAGMEDAPSGLQDLVREA